MFRVIHMMNSAGPGATGVKKERARKGRGMGWERQWLIEKGKKSQIKVNLCMCVCVNYKCNSLHARPIFKYSNMFYKVFKSANSQDN